MKEIEIQVKGFAHSRRQVERVLPEADATECVPMKMSVSEVIVVTKKFLKDEAGFQSVRVASVVAVEAESNWKVLAEIGQPTTDKKEIIVDDRDGKVVSYKQA